MTILVNTYLSFLCFLWCLSLERDLSLFFSFFFSLDLQLKMKIGTYTTKLLQRNCWSRKEQSNWPWPVPSVPGLVPWPRPVSWFTVFRPWSAVFWPWLPVSWPRPSVPRPWPSVPWAWLPVFWSWSSIPWSWPPVSWLGLPILWFWIPLIPEMETLLPDYEEAMDKPFSSSGVSISWSPASRSTTRRALVRFLQFKSLKKYVVEAYLFPPSVAPEQSLAGCPIPAAHAGEPPGFRGFASAIKRCTSTVGINKCVNSTRSFYLKINCDTWEASVEPLQPKKRAYDSNGSWKWRMQEIISCAWQSKKNMQCNSLEDTARFWIMRPGEHQSAHLSDGHWLPTSSLDVNFLKSVEIISQSVRI